MAGYAGKLLRVNLSTRETNSETIPDNVIADYVGGRGLGIYYLFQGQSGKIDPLGPANKLILMNGPLAGTSAQSSARWMAMAKSPLTGGFGRAVGGADFGAWLKFGGYDLIIVEGKADRPAYLHISNEGARILDAGDLWGLNTLQAQDKLIERHGRNTRVACVGPAAERGVLYSVIASHRRTASRCGIGTVMGSKNLKAVAITASRQTQLHDEAAFRDLVKEQVASMQADLGYQDFCEWGTTNASVHFNKIGIYPVRNFRRGTQEDHMKFSGEEYKKFRVGDFGCYSCSVRCGKQHRITSGPYAGAESEGPEYESIWAFNGSIDSTDIPASVAADQLCDDLGLDTISTGNTIGFAFELYEKGILTKADADGLELTYGNHAALVALIGKIGRREGLGDVLAEGVARAAQKIGKGAEQYAIHVKGMELPAYEPRAAKAHGLNFATSNIGASHCYGYAGQEIFGARRPRAVDRFADSGKGDIAVYNQDRQALVETGIVCQFAAGWRWFEGLFPKMMAAATGVQDFGDMQNLGRAGARIYNLEKLFNIREGMGRKDDTLPVRMQKEPLEPPSGPSTGQMYPNLQGLLDEYYQARGWNSEGIPTEAKLKELGLEWAWRSVVGR